MSLTNSAFRQNVGTNWSTVLDDVLKAAKNSPCNACPPASGITLAFPSMEKHLEIVDYFVTNFQANEKADKFFFWMRGKKKGGGMLADGSPLKSEMAQTLHELKRRNLIEIDINQFGAKYTTSPAAGTSRESDILLADGITHIELKNIPYTANSTPSTQAIDQVIGQNGAFGNISILSEFEWVAYANRGNTTTDLKTMWKKVFSNTDASQGPTKTQIFNNMSGALKGNLNLMFASDLNSSKIDEILNEIIKAE